MFAASKTSKLAVSGPSNDPYFDYVSLLLHGDGTNGGQNNTFYDYGANGFTVSRYGNTTQGTFVPFNGGNYSGSFNGTTDYISLSSYISVSGDFTFEFWAYRAADISSFMIPFSYGNNNGWIGWQSNATTFTWDTVISATVPDTKNTWAHYAITRQGSTVRLFVNGVLYNSATGSAALRFSSIGAFNNSSYFFNGYLSNIRLIDGSALYTAAFTPPTLPLTTTSQTILMTCASNRFEDLSGACRALSKAGDTSIQTFSPFNPCSYSPISYATYFDGAGDYLTSASAAAAVFGTGAYTVETWLYFAGGSAAGEYIIYESAPANGAFQLYVASGSNGFYFGMFGGTAIGPFLPAANIPLNQWFHIAISRASTASNQTSVYVNGTRVLLTTDPNNYTAAGISIAAKNTGTSPFTGSISNFRIVTGTALYSGTSITVPISGLTAVSGTTLLTCQSNTIRDNSPNAFSLVVNGNTQPIKGNPFGFNSSLTTGYDPTVNSGSSYFDGNGDYLTVPNSTAFTFGTGDFTVECWVYWNAATGSGFFGSGAAGGMDFAYDSGFLRIGRINTAWDSTFAFTPLINQWYHIAFTRSGSNTRAFVNGTQVGSTSTNTTNYSQNGGVSNIGVSNPADRFHNGYIAGMRVVKGTAVYTTQFTPTWSPPSGITNTQLLLLFYPVFGTAYGPQIYDDSMKNDLETLGAAQISTSVKKYGTGSISFNGTNSYLKSPYTPNLSLGNGNFTIEAWVNVTAIPATYGPIAAFALTNAVNTADTGFFLTVSSSGKALCFVNSSANTYFAQSTATFTTGTWTHVAAVRNGNTLTIYFNGVASGTTDLAGITVTNSTSFVFYSGAKQNSGTFYYLNGYIDDLRITKGFARYLSNFTPPTAAFPNY